MLGGKNSLASKPFYSFPELKLPEIIQCLEDMRIQVTESDLSKPTASTVQRIFEGLLDTFLGHVQWRDSGSVPSGASTENQDLLYDSINLVHFHRSASRLIVETGVEDFSLRDIIRPEPSRLRIILSAVINFAKFREEQLAVFDEFAKRSDEALITKNKLMSRYNELVTKVTQISEKHASEEPEAERLRAEMTNMINALREMKREQSNISAVLERLKEEKASLSERLTQSQFLMGNLKHECSKLKARIVHSPEKLMQIISEMSASIQSEKATISQLERKSRELQMKLDSLCHLEVTLTRILGTLSALKDDCKKIEEFKESIAGEKDKISQQQNLARDLASKEVQISRQLSLIQSKVDRLHVGQKERRDRTENRLKLLQLEYQQTSEDHQKANSRIEGNEKLIKEYEHQMSELRQLHESELASVRSECITMKSKVILYLNELKKHL